MWLFGTRRQNLDSIDAAEQWATANPLAVGRMKIHDHIPLLEAILGERSDAIGSQYEPYKNHVYRVVNFCFALHECQGSDEEKILVAGCFHDLGIWPNDTVDYLAPSISLAQAYLAQQNKSDWSEEISEMIELHHKIRRVGVKTRKC